MMFNVRRIMLGSSAFIALFINSSYLSAKKDGCDSLILLHTQRERHAIFLSLSNVRLYISLNSSGEEITLLAICSTITLDACCKSSSLKSLFIARLIMIGRYCEDKSCATCI